MSEKVDRKISASVRVTLTIEVIDLGSWGTDCTIGQLRDQAIESALGYLRHTLDNDPRIKVIGDIKVTGILARDES